MNSATPVQYAAVGIVLMQASVAVSLLGTFVRIALLATGMALICVGAVRSRALLPPATVTQLIVLLLCGALVFELLSWFNAHFVFEPKLIVFRWICWALFGAGALIGLGYSENVQWSDMPERVTIIAALVVASGLSTWFSVGSIVHTEGARGSFDESSPVALGFSSGTLAIAALAVGLRTQRIADYLLGLAGFGVWTLVALQSGSRGALISLGAISLGLIAMSLRCAPKRILALVAIALLVVSGRLAVDNGMLNQALYVFERFESLLAFEADPSIADAGSSYSRAYVLDQNLNLPGVFFLGGEGFSPETYPHNFEVEALVRLGAPLAIILIICVAGMLWKMTQILNRSECGVPLAIVFCMGLFTFVNAQTNMMWEFLRPLWLALGVAAGISMGRRCGRLSVDT